ncbi:MAG: serine/threonine protein kinase [Anaerolineae bacterium]|nr:serine/threonine protein kinase [Anaerolineae bacterium]
MDALIGKRLGQYEILSKLGSGGMAHVYRARQTSVDRDVAVKVIRTDLTEDAAFTERFAREARTIASLSHLHILKVFDYGQQEGIAYLVMELLEGGSLSTLIQKNGALALPTAARILKQIAGALDYAHDKGIIHRDLKADNVLLDTAENAYLTDFGIARLLNDTSKMTQTGTIMGTPAYMAPELWTGAAADKRADIYALGVILYEMINGNTPFSGDTPFVIMYQHLNEVPPVDKLGEGLPEAVEEVILKAMAKKPEDRYSSGGELANAFDAAIGGISETRRGLTPKPNEIVPDEGLATQFLSRAKDTTEANKPTVVEKNTLPPPSAAVVPPTSTSRRGWVIGAVIASVLFIGLFGLSRLQQQRESEAAATALALESTQTEAAKPTTTNTATVTPMPSATFTATISPTPQPLDTPAPTALAQLQFDTYTNQKLNVAFRYPKDWDAKVVQVNNIFVTEDYSKLDFSDPSNGIVGAPYIQISVGSSEELGVLDMKQAKTAEDALIAFMGRDRVTNLDPVPGVRNPTATSTRVRDDLGVTRLIYVTMLGTDRFVVAMLQATADVIQNYNQNVMLPLVRSVDNFTSPEGTPEASAATIMPTAIPTVFFATPSAFSTNTIAALGLEFVSPQGWVAFGSKQAGAMMPVESSEVFGNFANDDFNKPMNIYMRFDNKGFIDVRNPNDSIETIFADNYGSFSFNVTTLYDAPFPTAYARAGNQPVYGVAVDGWIALVKVSDDLYISIFAHAGAGKEDAFLNGVLLPVLKGFKSMPIGTGTPLLTTQSGMN